MINIFRPRPAALAITLLMFAAGCSTLETVPPSEAATQVAATGNVDEKGIITGSRVPRKTTDQMLRRIGASGAKEMDRERPPSPGPAVQ